jgi:hypothetical protein
MALPGIGGNGAGGGSPLDRFQQLRDAAQKKLESSDRQAGLADLIQRKQKQLGAGAATPGTARSQAERIPPGSGLPAGSAAPGNPGAADAVPAPSAYGRTGAARKQDTAPRLGRYVDFRA